MDKNARFDEDGKLIYPCQWIYRVIGEDAVALEKDLRGLFADKTYELKESNKKGKYTAYALSISVESELEREAIHMILKDSPFVKIVM